ncbi:MAG: tetratricopeptide repeat protein [Candidatus Acidiferrales bacterium]
MEVAVESSKARRVAFAGCVIVAAFLIAQVAWVWRANADIDAQDPRSIARGAHLIPGNAEAWDRLGRFRQWNFASSDPAGALRDYQRAVRDLPLSSYYWIDLAIAYEQTGNVGKANDAFQRAGAEYPTSAEVAWQYGNFLLRQHQVRNGLDEVHRAVSVDPALTPLAISRVWFSTNDVNVLLDRALPATVAAYFQALDFFLSRHDADSGLVVWNRLVALNQRFALATSFPLLDALISGDRQADTTKVWLEAIRASGSTYEPPLVSSLIWNWRFADPFTNGGLGWRWDSPVGVEINFDQPRIAVPARSVRLDFGGGNNTDLDAPFEYVAVQPNTVYRFTAYLKTEAISTESGIRFAISDPNHGGAVDVTTDNLIGTNPWTEAKADVITGPQTHFLVLRLYRPPSRLFDNKLSGTAWIADVSLKPSIASIEQESSKP